jgi:anti-sigma factor RsiW
MDRWTHRRYRRQVSAFVDGELDPPATAAMERHVRDCWGCSGAVEQIRLIKLSLARLSGRRPEPISAARLRRWARGLQG